MSGRHREPRADRGLRAQDHIPGGGPRELHQVLFAASDRHVWAGVRALALAAVGQVPGTAVAVVGLEAQRLGVAPMQVTESAAASLERDGARVEGKAAYGGSKKTARQAAALSLLAALTGLAGQRTTTRPPFPVTSRTTRG